MSGAIHNCRIFLAIAGLAVIGTVSAQEIYKWQDQKGTTHYGEIPPPMVFSSFEGLQFSIRSVGDIRGRVENSLERKEVDLTQPGHRRSRPDRRRRRPNA